ncbi:hypothetical protein ABIG04_009936 [Bradyrhizobium japonicum]
MASRYLKHTLGQSHFAGETILVDFSACTMEVMDRGLGYKVQSTHSLHRCARLLHCGPAHPVAITIVYRLYGER